MDDRKWPVAAILIAFAAFSACQVDEGGETSVWVGVKVDNDDYHACVVYTQPQHMPKELLCESVETPVNGGYEITTVSDDVINTTHHIIQYHCDRGYELVGHSNRTCNGTSKLWTNEEPHCEPKYVSELKRRLDTIEDKVTNIDNQIANMKNNTPTYDVNSRVEQLSKAAEQAVVGIKDGSLISEYTWTVKNMEEEIDKASGNESYYVESQPFYTNVPGYRVSLLLYPNYYNFGNVGLFMELVAGEFDNNVSWPFSHRCELSSVDRDGNRFAYDSNNPSTIPRYSEAFLRPPDNNKVCGTTRYINIATLLSNKDQYLIDGALSITVIFWLNN